MRNATATQARAIFYRLLRAVEAGERVTITRRGAPVAQLIPVDRPDPARVAQAIAGIKRLRQTIQPMSLAESLSARDEGRK